MDGFASAPAEFDLPEAANTAERETILTVPVMAEELHVEKRAVEKSRTRITKTVREREEVLDEPLMREEVVVERVPINRMVEGAAPPVRYEGDVMVIPLLEEVLVVEKRMMLKEELRVSRRQTLVHEPQTVILRSEEATVERDANVSEMQETGSALSSESS